MEDRTQNCSGYSELESDRFRDYTSNNSSFTTTVNSISVIVKLFLTDMELREPGIGILMYEGG